jgi:hypothetical protein
LRIRSVDSRCGSWPDRFSKHASRPGRPFHRGNSIEAAIGDKKVTYDFARLMEGADELSCSEFGEAMIARM